jgi:hypothetical protein
MLDASEEECQRRLTGRKIDPTTQVVYHPEDNPPPEGDAKLRDRLQDYTTDSADPARVERNQV